MDRNAALALAVYGALVLTLGTPLHDPLTSGRDDSWALLVVLAAAHLGLGAAIGRAWALALPVALSLAGFLAGGAEGTAWLAIVLGIPVLVACTAFGLALARVRHAHAIAAGCFAVALFPAVWAVVETARRGPPLPASVQGRLPAEVSVGNLCPGAESFPSFERDVRRRAEVLVSELRRRPTHLVTYTYYSSHGDDERREITVRELAEEQLKDMEPGCDPELERRLRDAM